MTAPVFVSAHAARARAGDVVVVDGDEGRHAVTVQRLRVGERVDVIDGAGRRASGTIAAASDGRMEVHVDAVTHDDDPDIVLVQALAKGGRDEQGVESAIELGATRIVPWQASRSIVQWKGAKADKALAKWRALALAAAKQSRRALVPAVAPVIGSRALADAVRTAVADGDRVLVLHETSPQPLVSLPWEGPASSVWLIVGPEGGIAEDELAMLTEAGAEPVLLGPHVLRASSAGPAAIAALAVLRGTWRSGPADAPRDGGLR